MTRYEQGFMNKCAEYGVDGSVFLNRTAPMKKQALVGGLTGFYTQRDDPNAPNASIGGKRGAGRGALASAILTALLAARGGPAAALGGALGGGLSGAITGYFGGRLAGHKNEKDRRNGVRGLLR